jgi:hypothetical protein
MKQLVIVIASNRPQPNEQLFKSLARFAAHGTAIVHHTGTTDVALARNISLSLTYNLLQQGKHNMVLMLDDDMVFSDDEVVLVLKHAYESERPTSACYVLASGSLAARRRNGKWSTGLGFLAIPAKLLLELGSNSPEFECPYEGSKSMTVREFTGPRITTKPDGKREWQGEDFVLCERLGGVDLIPVSVGHVKQQVLRPSQGHLKSFLEKQERE